MELIATSIADVKLLMPKKYGDHRGFFSETYNAKSLIAFGIPGEFVQDNHSLSVEQGVVRGLHYQIPPISQGKLLRVVHGSILDVAVDIRRDSPTFGKHVSALLSAENWRQFYVPPGFAHGFVTLEPDTQVLYKVTDYYSPKHERGIRWNDPDLAIDWGVNEQTAVLSDRDKLHPFLKDAADLF